ncbi:MAG: hypothetical protein COV07_01600 [Candidatus Vogelbacteria bacterium CG10_big_fil_rev_8_21_14_0_10_45_14]|uniref:FecR protein domain-containing protein n=1 Tax=Candidatus Vogelbacteria bacterium CG10_big_fil_rev_8_21_14_0_10_45_14 TaxID=1975042 RepID=A0A2H0RK74_9BACT|nr:MAG: hypothetical protein COV07_01600 [Candidatus Vogelbacteria bacterium CG10_big_fil_rev_8_21_14_0_10_45_14]
MIEYHTIDIIQERAVLTTKVKDMKNLKNRVYFLSLIIVIGIFSLPGLSEAAELRFVFDGLLNTNPSIEADVDIENGTVIGSKQYELRESIYDFSFRGNIASDTKILVGDFEYKSSSGGRTYETKGTVSLNPTPALFEGQEVGVGKIWEGNYSVPKSSRTGAVYVSLLKGELSLGSGQGAKKDANISVSAVSGDVKIKRADGKEETLTKDSKLRPGDSILTGYGSSVSLTVGEIGELAIPSLTNLWIELLESKDDLIRLQTHLTVGSVRARIKQNASMRGDFSVSSPSAIASIRGSEMIFIYDDKTGVSKLFVTEDKAYIRSNEGSTKETEIAQGYAIETNDTGLGEAREYNDDELLPTGFGNTRSGNSIILITILIAVLLVVVLFVLKKKRT